MLDGCCAGTEDVVVERRQEAAARRLGAGLRLVCGMRVIRTWGACGGEFEETAPEAEAGPDEAEEPSPEPVPNGADQSGEVSGPGGPSAHAPLMQTAPDQESEAE
ncbi:hypothetical protein SLUN_16575 [Streptomyces lunaelactis]|uniref:Uncharacterized protein n=1 Tax=Streptomyces lunaelactis TaxID=1535768 RepID=A0A2R4T374_9ACTN|nr:hypothetical protein SLUN_16575 [Streptomyces lunaelactis]